MMTFVSQIRRYQATDVAEITRLEARVQPYRPEDQTEVHAMYVRAAEAERQTDPRWMASPTHDSPTTPESYRAFWVAEQRLPAAEGVIVGTAAVQPFCAGEEMAPTHPLAQLWDGRNDVIELRRVRVAPEVRSQGIGTQLCQTAIDWARAQGYRLMVVNTTTPQVPALQLYRRLGFQAVGKSFIDQYELIWSELQL